MKEINVAIIGTGNIGTDLLVKVVKSPFLNCSLFVGRNINSNGIQFAKKLGIRVSDRGIQELIENESEYDIVFDATSAADHLVHSKIFKDLGKFVIDMTPAKVGAMCVPSVNLHNVLENNNINTVTCGGQASIPIAYALSVVHSNIEYIEVVSTIASKSAGAATRRNLDEYIETTEYGLKLFSKAKNTKAILNLNPAEPCINMQTTIFAEIDSPNMEEINLEVKKIVKEVSKYVPGYNLIISPVLENGRVMIMVGVHGAGDYLPEYAGNLDIINCAAINIAEEWAKNKLGRELLL